MKRDAEVRDILVSLQNAYRELYGEALTSEMTLEFLREKLAESKTTMVGHVLSLNPRDLQTAIRLLSEQPEEKEVIVDPKPKAKKTPRGSSKRKSKVQSKKG